MVPKEDETMPFILVGNKCDLDESRRQISWSRAGCRAKIWDVPYVETSAISGYNVNKIFCDLIKDIQTRNSSTFDVVKHNKEMPDEDKGTNEFGCCKGCLVS